MAIERTISIIKPDAVEKNVIGKIYSRFEENGLRIIAAKMKHLSERNFMPYTKTALFMKTWLNS